MEANNSLSSYSHLFGQERAKSLLGRSLASGKIAHGYLFRGPSGVGKSLFAKATAMALNCRESGGHGFCGQCVSCRKFISGNHPDFEVIKPEKGTIRIDRVRELCKSLSYPPYESEKRVVVIEEIHTMRPEAANSLLKTLEEPPENNVLILTAETSKAILDTISSRCQIVPFFPLSREETTKILVEKHEMDSSRADLLARLSEGCPGQALLLHTKGMIETWEELVGVLENESYINDRHTMKILELAEKMSNLKEDLNPLLGLLRIWLRDKLFEGVSTTGKKEKQSSSVETIFTKLEAINRAEMELSRNCNRSLVCEVLLFRLQ